MKSDISSAYIFLGGSTWHLYTKQTPQFLFLRNLSIHKRILKTTAAYFRRKRRKLLLVVFSFPALQYPYVSYAPASLCRSKNAGNISAFSLYLRSIRRNSRLCRYERAEVYPASAHCPLVYLAFFLLILSGIYAGCTLSKHIRFHFSLSAFRLNVLVYLSCCFLAECINLSFDSLGHYQYVLHQSGLSHAADRVP